MKKTPGHPCTSAVLQHGSRSGAGGVRFQRQDRDADPEPDEVQAVQRWRCDLRRNRQGDEGLHDAEPACGVFVWRVAGCLAGCVFPATIFFGLFRAENDGTKKNDCIKYARKRI